MLQRVRRGLSAPGGNNGFNGVSVVASATAHVKGAWAELIASTDQPGETILVFLDGPYGGSASQVDALLDVGFGPAGAEQVVVSNLNSGNWNSANQYVIPLRVPKGTRIALRHQSNVGSKSVAFSVNVIAGVGESPQSWVTYGANTTNSQGVLLPAVTTAKVKTAWTELVASTTAVSNWVSLTPGLPTTNSPGTPWTFDIGVGAAGAERLVVENYRYNITSTELVRGSMVPFPVAIPAGQRLSVRYTTDTTTATHTPTVCVHTAA